MYLIVGIDPGTRTGLAFLDLSGNLVGLQSQKHKSYLELIKIILKQGQPIIISCDVTKIPSVVEKIASKFNALLYLPDHDLKVKEKKRLIHEFFKDYFVKIEDKHERDALASALTAYNHFSSLFSKIKRRVRPKDVDKVKKKILLKQAHSIRSAMKEF